MSVVVIEYLTLDGRVSDPDGRAGTPHGGWIFRHGPEATAGDKFRLGEVLDEGVLLLGRRTWELFSTLWPNRDDPFSARMNAATKLVASHTLTDVSAWQNSRLLDGDLVETIENEPRDVVITGSLGIVHLLMEKDLIDEYRLLTLPTVLGDGAQLFPPGRALDLRCLAIEPVGAAVFARYGRSTQ